MPLKLVPPRAGKTPNYAIRGTHLGQYVDRTAGTPDRKTATRKLNQIKDQIERGVFAPKGALTFSAAALNYLRMGGDDTFLDPLTDHFESTPMVQIGQAEIDEAAHLLYPGRSAATLNRQVYTPMSAIMKSAGISTPLRRPKGAQGRTRTEWMTPDQAERLLNAVEDAEFRAFLATLIYTGLRLSEALAIECRHVDLSRATIFVPDTKNGDPRAVHIPQTLLVELANHPRGLKRLGYLFRFQKNGHLYSFMKKAKEVAALPNVSFHTCRHTWATWMRLYAGLDTKGLVGTGAWRDQKSAARYQHVVVTDEARKADLLPVLKRGNGGESVE